MTIQKNDFINLEFTGVIKDTDEVFDTNVKKIAEENKFDTKNLKPFILSVGHKMLPEGFDEDLIGKDIGKDYTLEIAPEKAFGKRDKKLVKLVPTKLFLEQKIRPERGMQLSVDGQLVKILSVSAQRTLVDFNNPLAGKNLTYTYKILKKVEDNNEKVKALQEFLFRREFPFKIEDKNLTITASNEEEKKFIEMFKDKFKEILDLEIKVKIKKSAK